MGVMSTAIKDPLLSKWLFPRYKLDPEAITITAVDPQNTVHWTAKHPSDSMEIWFRADEGTIWRPLDRVIASSGTFSLLPSITPEELSKAPGVKLALVNKEGFVYGLARFPINRRITGLPEKDEKKLVIYPNPAKDMVHVRVPLRRILENPEYQIVSLLGHTMMTGVLTHDLIDITDMAGGIYFLAIRGENWSAKQKLIVAK